MLVDLMIIGSQKSATTTLFDVLQASKKIDGCLKKEPNFFTKINWRDDVEKYHSLFTGTDDSLRLEASTQYTFYPHIDNKNIVSDIYQYNPEMKFIYVIRNPIDRIISAYMHSFQSGFVTKNIDDVIKEGEYFIDVTRYAEQIEPYIDKFGRDKILILDFDDIVLNIDKTIFQIEIFLGENLYLDLDSRKTHSNQSLNATRINRNYRPIFKKLGTLSNYLPPTLQNLGKQLLFNLSFLHGPKVSSKPKLSPETISYLKQELGSQREKMEKITGRSLNHWESL